MNCAQCGAEVSSDASFCPSCGARVDGADASAAKAAGNPFKPKNPPPRGSDTETEIWNGGYSPKAMLGAWIGAGVVTIAALIAIFVLPTDPVVKTVVLVAVAALWIGLALRLAVKRLSVGYRLTNQRFFYQYGLLSRVTDRIEVLDMDDITFRQGLFERMVGVGSILISSSDRTSPEIWLRGIDNVREVADVLDKARRAERRLRSVHVEQI